MIFRRVKFGKSKFVRFNLKTLQKDKEEINLKTRKTGPETFKLWENIILKVGKAKVAKTG